MIDIFRGYVRTNDKKPIQKFKGVETLPTLEEVSKYDEYAGILNDDYVVMDIDDGIEADKAFELVKHLNLNCKVVNTSRGKHFIFKKNPELKLKGTTKNINALGFTFDIRIGINQYIVVKYKGVIREVVRDFDETKPIETFPRFFAPITSTNVFTSMGDGDGRNGKLFSHIATLSHCGFKKDEIIDIVTWINMFCFDDPLSDSEMKSITRDESFSNLVTFDIEEDFKEEKHEFVPSNYSDVAMAELFANYYKDELRYNKGTDWLVWNGKVWELSDLKAQKKYIEFLKKVLKAAQNELKKAFGGFNPSKEDIAKAQAFYNYVIKMSDAGKISSVLKIARSFLEIDVSELDANPFELNTPNGIINLKDGTIRSHDATSFCTKITNASMSDDGLDMWMELLNKVTGNDPEYISYLQVICGVIAIGKVYNEAMVIAHGNGHNGKSTLFNTIYKVLGDYSGKIPADALTTKVKTAKVELAELFGKRFILASETEEGQKLSNQMLKQIASTDAITGEKKYHDPFVFEPTHTALLYTNFLPRIASLDNGTKRRIIVCPFNQVIDNPKKDYAEKLYEHSKGAILKWVVEGAKRFFESDYKLPPCKAVDSSKDEYIQDNDWLSSFLEDCCNVGEAESQTGSVLYKAYRQWCNDTGEYPKRNRDFAQALLMCGFECKKTKKCNVWKGLSLDPTRTKGKTIDTDFL